jgi:hypothetical protein
MLLARAFEGTVFLFAVIAIVFIGLAGPLRDGRAWAILARLSAWPPARRCR